MEKKKPNNERVEKKAPKRLKQKINKNTHNIKYDIAATKVWYDIADNSTKFIISSKFVLQVPPLNIFQKTY